MAGSDQKKGDKVLKSPVFLRTVLDLLLMILFYECLSLALSVVFRIFMPQAAESVTAMTGQFTAALICILIIGRRYIKTAEDGPLMPGSAVLLAGSGFIAGLAGNLLLNMTRLSAGSEGFQEASAKLFGTPVYFQIISLCLVIPLYEELVYRGMIQRELHLYFGKTKAILISSLVFALIHGNIIQGVYAFVTGIILGTVYEKYHSLRAPYIFHIMANLAAIILGILC